MSSPVTALRGRSFAGYVTVAEDVSRGMIQVKGALSDDTLRQAVQSVTGAGFPDPLSIVTGPEGAAAWMAPDELLILTDPDAVADRIKALSEALAGMHHLVLDVSDMRVAIRLDGAGLREVLAKVTPIDMQAMTPGMFRRTRLAQVPGAIWMSGPETAHILCFRSVARYVFDLLSVSARKGGEVHLFEGFHQA